MRARVLICLIAALSAGLAACASAPRDPARVEYRNAGRSFTPAAAPSSCNGGYVVRSGDTLSQIAQSCGVAMRDLADANGLRSPYTLRTGQQLRLPNRPVHVVQRGENLYRIGLRYDIPFQQIASHNGIAPPYELEVGQQIHLPAGAGTASSQTTRYTRPDSSAPRNTRREPPARGAPSFDWPVRGEVVSTFGRKPEGGRNDGINIAVRAGTEVRAAAPGQVVYAGSELAGYGRLVLIRHDGGFVTAYAHNSRIHVSEGDRIERGQVIAAAGSSGTVDSPQVHFEIRRGVNPEDPMRYLR